MNSSPLTGRDLAAALAVVVIWGLNFVAMKFALHDFTPFQLGAARYLFAALPLVFIVKMPRLHWKWVLLYGLFQGVGQFGFLFCALKVGMTGALASVLMQTQVFFTALFGFVLLKERLSRQLSLGLVLAALGLACFTMNFVTGYAPLARASGQFGLQTASVATFWGFVLNVCAAAMWGASNIVAKKAQHASPDFDALGFVVWSSLAPILPFVLLTALLDDNAAAFLNASTWGAIGMSTWLSLLMLGWVATVAAYTMWTNLLKRHSANRVAPFSLGVPVVGLASGIVILGEAVTLWQWAGVALILLALMCVLLGGRWLNR
jgi:O-acetylserine/cysteine efflux transporter